MICVEKSNIKDTPMLFGDRRCGTLQEDPSVHGEIQAEVAGRKQRRNGLASGLCVVNQSSGLPWPREDLCRAHRRANIL